MVNFLENNKYKKDGGESLGKINIVDSRMGEGKSSWAIQKMKEDDEHKFIYITPYLDEIQRVINSVDNKKFYEPKNFGSGKLDSLHNLIVDNKDIASTHALFQKSNTDTLTLLQSNNYILILDEVIQVVDFYNISKNDFNMLLNDAKKIRVKEDGFIEWIGEEDYEGKFTDFKNLCYSNALFYHKNKILVWLFPVEIFKSFEEVYILTYLFDCQIQRFYFDMFNLEYEYHVVKRKEDSYELEFVGDKAYKYDNSDIKALINIYEGRCNYIGDDYYNLSTKWFEKNKKDKESCLLKQLKTNIESYFRNADGNASQRMWTCLKDYKKLISGKGYSKEENFVSLNCRATNQYSNRISLAYCSNIFMNPIMKQFFIDNGVKIDAEVEAKYGLSECIQWLWRSCIRNGEPINIYIPSKRMRTVLIKWLNNNL